MKVCLQAGHLNTNTSATGAPGEMAWNKKFRDLLASELIKRGIEVYKTDANLDDKVRNTDWDLFLAIHYDADIYNTNGGFIDTPEASFDFATVESNRIAKVMRANYFKRLGLPEHNERSNANTKYYYAWSELTANTPCVLLEAGIGWRKPDDYELLHNNTGLVVLAVADGICEALGVSVTSDCELELIEVKAKRDEYREQRDSWKRKYNEVEDAFNAYQEKKRAEVADLEKSLTLLNEDLEDKDIEIDSLNKTIVSLKEQSSLEAYSINELVGALIIKLFGGKNENLG